MAISDYADKDGKVNLIPEADYNTPEETPDVKADNNNYNSKENNTRREQRRERRASNANPTRNNRNTELRRKTGKLGIKSSLDSFFGSGRDDQGLGQTPGIFQAQKAQLQADIDRENQRLDTVAAAEAELEAARVTQEGRHEVEAADREFERVQRTKDILNDDAAATEALKATGLDRQEMQRIFDRVQNGLDITDTERAQYEAFYRYGRAHMAARAGQARIEATKDGIEHQRMLRDAFKQYGANLSQRMNDQQIANMVASLEQMSAAEARVLGENAEAMGRAMGLQSTAAVGEKLDILVGAYQKAQAAAAAAPEGSPERQAATLRAAAIREQLGVGVTKQVFQQFMNSLGL